VVPEPLEAPPEPDDVALELPLDVSVPPGAEVTLDEPHAATTAMEINRWMGRIFPRCSVPVARPPLPVEPDRPPMCRPTPTSHERSAGKRLVNRQKIVPA
jgi:hypothetical protein